MSIHREGQTVECIAKANMDGLTLGKRYLVTDEDYHEIGLIDDDGMLVYVGDKYFRDALELADERMAKLESRRTSDAAAIAMEVTNAIEEMVLGFDMVGPVNFDPNDDDLTVKKVENAIHRIMKAVRERIESNESV